jgi:ferredoxin-thioredoxin reductase catalytic subunit/rubredoxin
MSNLEPSEEEVQILFKRLNWEAEEFGYHLNPDEEHTKDLIRGLIINELRYGYWACPCRLATGEKEMDLDIICPCDYRDLDLSEFGACYCGLYVSEEIIRGKASLSPVPERRLPPEERERELGKREKTISISSLPLPVWRCRVCGYLCAREQPPETCPICKVKKERFERFI